MPLIIVGVLFLALGVVCLVRWRRYSLAHKADLQQKRKK